MPWLSNATQMKLNLKVRWAFWVGSSPCAHYHSWCHEDEASLRMLKISVWKLVSCRSCSLHLFLWFWAVFLLYCVCVSHSVVSNSDSMDCSSPVSSVHGILQKRILEWVANPFSRGSSWPSDQIWILCIAGTFLTVWVTREAQSTYKSLLLLFCG